MKRLVLMAVLAAVGFSGSDAYAARTVRGSAQCSSIVPAASSLFIYKNSAPLRKGGVGTPLVGYRNEPTLIMNKNVSSRGRATIFSTNWQVLGSCPWASAHGHSGGRFRCGMNTGGLRKAAIKASRSAAVLIKINARTCVKVEDAGRCYGSVKGRCGSLIK